MQRIERFERDGLSFDVTDRGPLDGPVTILLHGFPQDRGTWDAVADRLTLAGVRTLTPDQRGYSPGARPRGVGSYRPRELVRDVVGLADTAGARRFSVVGHDWGAVVGWWLARAVPQRLDRLTVVSTPHPRAVFAALFSSDQAVRASYLALVQVPVLAEALIRPRLARMLRSSGLPEDIARRYAERMSEPGALTAAFNWYRAALLPGGGRAGGRGAIRVPTRYVWGSRDPVLRRRAAELTADYVAAPYDFVELTGGHWLPEMHADELAGLILRPL